MSPTNTDLLDALEARSGIVCAVGAGGKKTTLYRLLAAHPGRVAFTTTVFMHEPPPDLDAHVVVAPPERIVSEVLAAAERHRKLLFACPSDKPGRYAGLSPEQVLDCHVRGAFDLTLVKADGARMRLIKAPGDDEPNLPASPDTVLGLVSARAIGRPLSERTAHRPERLAAMTGADVGRTLTCEHVARLIAADDGLFRGAGTARCVPVINMADGPGYQDAALETARLALTASDRYDRVVVAAMRADQPLVAVVRR